MTELSPPAAAPRNFVTTILAMVWMFGGRGFGLLWTVALLHQLGVSDYGMYGMALAVTMIVGPSVDNPFAVRAIRESDERFAAERTTRFLLAVGLMALGLVLISEVYFIGFGLLIAGGENASNVIKSRMIRDGRPDRAYRIDTARQVTSVLAGGTYLYVAHAPSLLVASLLYCVPYVVITVVGAYAVRTHRPGIPGPPRLIAALTGEMLGTTVYLQGDVLLLGWLTNSTIVGYYTLTWVVAGVIIAAGQSFAMTYHEPLRLAGGALSAGPPLRHTLGLAAAGGAVVLVVGIVLLFTPQPTQLAVAMMIMSGFAGLRSVSWVFQTILYNQRRDLIRLAAAVVLIPVKLGILASLAFLGAVGAAIASTTTDVLLLAIFATVLYGRKYAMTEDRAATEEVRDDG